MRIGLAVMMAVTAPAATQMGAQAAIDATLAASAAGWNAGDLDRFVAIYAGDAVFVDKDGLMSGKPAIAARYRDSFTGDANRRGRLTIRPVAFRTLSAVHALYVGRWTLTPATGEPQTGMTTLLFERRREGWRIIADHSS